MKTHFGKNNFDKTWNKVIKKKFKFLNFLHRLKKKFKLTMK